MQNLLASMATGDRYVDALDLLLRSIERLQNKPAVHVGCIDWSGPILDRFRSRYAFCVFVPFSLATGGRDAVISAKSSFIAKTLDSSPPEAILLYTDADHIVLKELSPWFETMRDHDLALTHRPQFAGRLRHEYLAGLVGVRNNQQGNRALRQWQALVAERPDQWVDQETLPALYRFCQANSIRVWRMGQDCLSADSGNLDAYLWARRSWELPLDERLRDSGRVLDTLSPISDF